MAAKPLLKFSQIRRVDSTGLATDEEAFARGRYFPANCLGTDVVGDFVQITGDKVAGLAQVSKVDITDASTMPAIGVILQKDSLTDCFVQTFGIIPASGLVSGARYWVGADSQLAAVHVIPPTGEIAVAQVVGVALDPSELLLRPDYQAHILRR